MNITPTLQLLCLTFRVVTREENPIQTYETFKQLPGPSGITFN